MSTRANVIIKDAYGELIFYRHAGGDPTITCASLRRLLGWVNAGHVRGNLVQAAGWLIAMGREEQHLLRMARIEEQRRLRAPLAAQGVPTAVDEPVPLCFLPDSSAAFGWKVGSYEPTYEIHGDIDYLYVVDLVHKSVYIDGYNGYAYVGQFRPDPAARPRKRGKTLATWSMSAASSRPLRALTLEE